MTVIAIEEHWTTPKLTAALKGLPEERRDDSLAFNEMGDNLARLEDIGDGRIAAMDEQGIDLQILSVAPPATGPLDPADAVVAQPGDERPRRRGGAPPPVPAAGDVSRCRWPTRAPSPASWNAPRGSGASARWSTGAPARLRSTTRCYDDLFADRRGPRPADLHPPADPSGGSPPGGLRRVRPDDRPRAVDLRRGDGTSRPPSPRSGSSPGAPSTATPISRSSSATGASCCCSGRTG